MLATLTSSRKLLAWVALGVMCMCASIAFAAYASGQRATATTERLDAQRFAIHQTCVAVQNLNRVITQTLLRSRTNIPKLAYYQRHPDELELQISEINHELHVFRPRQCR